MKHKPRLFSRIAAIVLALAMVLTALPQSVFAMDSSEIDSAIPLTLDEPVAFHSDDGKLLLSFTPEETRDYVFYMTDSDNCEPYAELYDADLMLITSENPTYTRTYYDSTNFDVSVRPENHDSSKQFVGWQDAYGTVYDWNSQVSQDLTVYAQWADATTITFHANGGYFTEWDWDYEADQEIERHVDSVSDTYFKEDILFSWNTPTPENEDPAKAFAGFATTDCHRDHHVLSGRKFLPYRRPAL